MSVIAGRTAVSAVADRPAAPAAPTVAGFDRGLIAPMILGSILNPINSSMIAIALVPIGLALGASPSRTAWLVTALYLATAVGQPVIGRLVDAYGPRRLYLIGTSLVGIAGLVGALSPSLGVLIGARVLLGFGTSAAYPASMSLTRSEAERTGRDSPARVLTALSVANQTISVIGPTLGGLLIGLGGWRMIFTVNVPLSLACLVLGMLRLPKAPPRGCAAGGVAPRRSGGVDIPGMALFAATLVTTMLFLMGPRVSHLPLLALAAVAGTGFALHELRVPQPFIDLRILGGNGPLLSTYLRQVLAYTTSYAFMYGYAQWLEVGRGLTTSRAGLLLLPVSVSALVVSGATGRNPGFRRKLLAGGVLQIAACAVLTLVGTGSAIWVLIGVGLLMGVPSGLIGLANQNALYHQTDPARMGSAAGLLRTFMYLGAMIASSANAAFFRHGATSAGLHGLAWFTAVVSVLFLAVTLADRSLRRLGDDHP